MNISESKRDRGSSIERMFLNFRLGVDLYSSQFYNVYELEISRKYIC